MNNKIKRFSVFLSLLIVVLCSITLLTSCDKDIEKTMNAKVTLRESRESRESEDRFFVKFYPDNTKSQFIEIDIPKRLNAQNIDLTQQGDWKVIGLGFYGEDGHVPFEKGSYIYINKISDKQIKVAFSIKQYNDGKLIERSQTYEGPISSD